MMNINKRKKELINLLSPLGWELHRQHKHFVFRHKITNRKLVTGKSTNCRRVYKNVTRIARNHDKKYLPQNDNFITEKVVA
ncbi:hypothetical protein OAQ23_00045 [Hellea sp.]|nr:hypothetical protein [Hellea sp.]